MRSSDEVISFRIKVLLDRLERLSADSIYAHKASGIRGGILRYADAGNENRKDLSDPNLIKLIEQGYRILNRAAKEIPE